MAAAPLLGAAAVRPSGLALTCLGNGSVTEDTPRVFDTRDEQGSGAGTIEWLQLDGIRALAQRLQSSDLWLSSQCMQRFLRTQRALGRILERQALMPLFASTEHAQLSGRYQRNELFQPIRMRLPLILAFGGEIGAGLHELLFTDKTRREAVSRTCALFNLGISLFDRVCDGPREGFAGLQAVFDEQVLHRLASGDGTDNSLRRAASVAPDPSIRTLLILILGFFTEMQQLDGSPAARRRINEALIEAYRAEMATMTKSADGIGLAERTNAARRKSTLPFIVMLAVARQCGDQTTGDVAQAEGLVECLGAVFSLTDDLVDLARDYRSGDANTILLGAGARRPSASRLGQYHKALCERQIPLAVDGIVTNLAAAAEITELSAAAGDVRHFRDVLVGYTQSWLRADRYDLTAASSSAPLPQPSARRPQ
jgi:hypothetical protein